jgi:hypothetical protein
MTDSLLPTCSTICTTILKIDAMYNTEVQSNVIIFKSVQIPYAPKKTQYINKYVLYIYIYIALIQHLPVVLFLTGG